MYVCLYVCQYLVFLAETAEKFRWNLFKERYELEDTYELMYYFKWHALFKIE